MLDKNDKLMLKLAREKKHRLPLNYYKGKIRVTFTLCVKNKKYFFIKKNIVDNLLVILKAAKNQFDCKNWLYIFMPDHLHLILEGNSDKSDLWKQ